MDGIVDVLQIYHSPIFQLSALKSPTVFLSRLCTKEPVVIESSPVDHHFNLQLKGCAQFDLADGKSSDRHLVVPGKVSLNPAYRPLAYRFDQNQDSMSLHVVLPLSWLEEISGDYHALTENSDIKGKPPIIDDWNPEIQRISYRIVDALLAPSPPMRIRMGEALLDLGFSILNWQGRTKSNAVKKTAASFRLSSEAIVRAVDFMHGSLTQDISLKEIAMEVGVEEWFFAKGFRNSMGVSPWKYFRDLRLAHARELLLKSEIPIKQIAVDLGFGSTSHFAAAFRESVGCAPQKFRQLIR